VTEPSDIPVEQLAAPLPEASLPVEVAPNLSSVEPTHPIIYAVKPSFGEQITSLATGNTYTIEYPIGEGFFGEVYACTDVWGNELAVKVMKPIGAYEEVKAKAEAEFLKLMHLRSPFITFVHDAFEFRNTFYIVTERCAASVQDLLQWPNLNGKGALWLMPIARCLLQAVQYLHNMQFVHQDIHPGNVFTSFVKDEMVKENPTITQFKLGDLGVARFAHEVDATNTRANWMLPPEVLNPAEFGPTDRHIDIYHLGLLFLQLMYSKELQFSVEDVLAGRPRGMAETLPAPYGPAISRALRRHVEHRTPDAMTLWLDLNGR
jgi:eukaryotic-like serine/threonine-protein kinase